MRRPRMTRQRCFLSVHQLDDNAQKCPKSQMFSIGLDEGHAERAGMN